MVCKIKVDDSASQILQEKALTSNSAPHALGEAAAAHPPTGRLDPHDAAEVRRNAHAPGHVGAHAQDRPSAAHESRLAAYGGGRAVAI